MAEGPIAVIDIGSNSGRVVVVVVSADGHLQIVADTRAPLRLGRDVASGGLLGPAALDRTVVALRDFTALARGGGAVRTIAVATSAVREAANGEAFVDAVRELTGVEVRVIDGRQEAAFAFLGAVHGLPVDDGLLFDIGGGSVELSRFRERELGRTWTLPLGALRLSDDLLRSDPPGAEETEALARHVRRALEDAEIPALASGEWLVGTGGTVRNLARMDARRHRTFIPHLHGYQLPAGRYRDLATMLAGRKLARRRSTPGLNADRADSIVGGALVVLALIEFVGAGGVLVSGQGLREGVALTELGMSTSRPTEVRRASVAALTERFSTWDPARAARRVVVVERLAADLDPEAQPEQVEMLAHAATTLDVGRAVDYYDRFAQAAGIALSADLTGFSHRHLAMLSAITLHAAGERPEPYRAELSRADREWAARAGAILALADEIESRTPPGEPVSVSCRVRSRQVVLAAPALAAWRPGGLANRFRRAFGRRLVIEEAG